MSPEIPEQGIEQNQAVIALATCAVQQQIV